MDGVLRGSGFLTAGTLVVEPDGLWLAQEQDCDGGCFDANQAFIGLIDEVEIFNRALAATEIKAIYDAGRLGKIKPAAIAPPPGMIGWWPGDGNSNDIVGSNH